jgi:hypothetical protein
MRSQKILDGFAQALEEARIKSPPTAASMVPAGVKSDKRFEVDTTKLKDIDSLAPVTNLIKEAYIRNSLMGSTRLFGDAECHAYDTSRA